MRAGGALTRHAVRIGAVLTLSAAAAGCAGLLDGSGSDSASPSPSLDLEPGPVDQLASR